MKNIQLQKRVNTPTRDPLYPIGPHANRFDLDKVAFRLNFCETRAARMMFIRRSDTLHGSEAPMWLNTQGVVE